MKLIGITGNGGSGKTTFTKTLEDMNKVGVIHVDDLVGAVKTKYFKAFAEHKKNNEIVYLNGEKKNPKLKSNVKRFFYKSKPLFNLLMSIRSNLIKKELEAKIAEFKKQGKDVVFIDDWALETHKGIKNKLSHVYRVRREFTQRREGLRKRDNITTKELAINDMPYVKRYLKAFKNDITTSVIDNNGTIEELEEKAKEIANKYIEKTFDEKYKVEQAPEIVKFISPELMIQNEKLKRKPREINK